MTGDNSTNVMNQWIETEAGQVVKRFETWEQAEKWREGHAKDVFAMPRLEENGGDDCTQDTRTEQ